MANGLNIAADGSDDYKAGPEMYEYIMAYGGDNAAMLLSEYGLSGYGAQPTQAPTGQTSGLYCATGTAGHESNIFDAEIRGTAKTK